MKKFLLFFVAAGFMFSATAGNAHSKKVNVDFDGLTVKSSVSIKAVSSSVCPFAVSKSERKTSNALPRVKMSSAMAAPGSINDFEGDFLQYYMDYAGDIEAPNVLTASFFVDSETNESGEVEELVVIYNALDGECELYAQYNAEEGTLSILSGYYCENHDTYGKFAFYTYTSDESGEEMELSQLPYVLEIGTDDAGKIILTPAEQDVDGWLILMTEGDYQGYLWSYGESLEYFQPNGYFDGRERHPENGSWTSYVEVETPVYVYKDDFMGNTCIYNMFNSVVEINEDGNGNFELPNGQVVGYGYDGSDYFPFYIYNCGVDEEGYLDPRMEEDLSPAADLSLPGFVATLEDGSIDYVFGAYNEEEPNRPDWDYVYVAKFTSPEGYGYFKNLWAAMEVVVEPATAESIQTVKTKCADKYSYNLMGQKVLNANAAGLYIQNGKKTLVK